MGQHTSINDDRLRSPSPSAVIKKLPNLLLAEVVKREHPGGVYLVTLCHSPPSNSAAADGNRRPFIVGATISRALAAAERQTLGPDPRLDLAHARNFELELQGMVRFAGQLTEADFTRAQWLSSPRIVRWLGWIIVGSFVAATVMGQLEVERDNPASLIPLVLMFSFAVFIIVAPRRAIKKVWRSTPLLHESVEGSIDSECLHWKTESSDIVLSWDKMIKAKIGSDLILLYTSLNQALIMPRSYFANDHDWRSAREIAEKRVSRA